MATFAGNLGTPPDNTVTFTTGSAIDVGFTAGTHAILEAITASASNINSVATANMATFAGNLGTPPDNTMTFTTGSAIDVGFAAGTHAILEAITCAAADINAGTCTR